MPLSGVLYTQDFLQILSIFASFKFQWPAELTAVFNALSLASFNLEFLAPECTLSIHYIDRWLATSALPVLLGVAVAIVLTVVKVLQVGGVLVVVTVVSLRAVRPPLSVCGRRDIAGAAAQRVPRRPVRLQYRSQHSGREHRHPHHGLLLSVLPYVYQTATWRCLCSQLTTVALGGVAC